MSAIERKIEQLEVASVDALLDFLASKDPKKALIERARVAQGAFANIQRRRSAENQREALAVMMARQGVTPYTRALNTGSIGSASTD